MRIPSIHDVANHLGLSISTVSFVINGKANQHRISTHTVKRVNDYIQKIGFMPDKRAQSFRTKKTGIIGLLVEDFIDYTTIAVMKELETICFRYGYKIVVQQLDSSDKAVHILNSLHDRQIEGYLIMLSQKIPKLYLNRQQRYPIPVIFFTFNKDSKNDLDSSDDKQISLAVVDALSINNMFNRLKEML
ncbi:LacI family DNA-binding transcriptional regulator [Olivibacter sp. SDN3]|uniref:LacI family DNA-binding transcriptional regulator n=1 Tax=Olivibacter sp. SDN3 TaxID=2764720 RepID=UPI00165186C8|nr:LacI family DNA-binding transcriptional regulator [Olivibacter sp. SDN3]QNL49915.1 LacI family DNA-binding transcriptional regulator [Olivibacter sp. SDN3]